MWVPSGDATNFLFGFDAEGGITSVVVTRQESEPKRPKSANPTDASQVSLIF
jgi:hypothetical protein